MFISAFSHAETLAEAIAGGKANLDIRYRLETVEQDNALQDATASTVRTLLGYKTGAFHGFSAYIEMEDIHPFGDEDYNVPGLNTNPAYSAVADPIGTELNQSYLDFTTGGNTFRYGRQQITLDNHRFIGNVGWRQNKQTYDAFLFTNKSVEMLEITAGMITRVNDIVFNDINHEDLIFNIGYGGSGFGKLSFYYYGIENQSAPDTSVETTGLRFSGSASRFLYTLEFANQQDYADSVLDIDADYSLIEFGVKVDPLTIKLGNELLGTGGADGFETPLATKHAFNGWADIFLNTPPAGLQDTYLSVSGKAGPVALAGIFHNFTPDTGGEDYGTELDLLAEWQITGNYSGGLKYAGYSADSFSVDTDKLWLYFQAVFK
jgi:hypothetical protein